MRDLTLEQLDRELAEQLPARELMSGCPQPCHPCGPKFKVILIVAVSWGGHGPNN